MSRFFDDEVITMYVKTRSVSPSPEKIDQ
uniref:Transposase n=1 Tax=Heterorhabditis bacteriophora TaxID=37862 RepID=A0A1I7WQM6_HETBA